jgi:LAS superfamily LD-carboxypeptidase LdcB
MKKQFLAGLSALSYFCASAPPGIAQVVSGVSQESGLGTWEQTPGGGDAWVETPPPGAPFNTGLSYNVWRAVPTNASLGRTIKFGDLSNTVLPNGAQYFQDRNRSMQDLLSSQGQSTNTTKIGDSSYTSSLTLGEVIAANGGKLPSSLESKLKDQRTSSAQDLAQLRALGGSAGSVAKVLSDNPAIKEIPLSELASGDFQGALDIGVQRGAQEAIKNLPAKWKDLPVGAIAGALASGDYKAALQEGVKYGGKKLADYILKTNALKNLPVGAIAKDLPISELGNITKTPLATLPRVGSQYLSKIPGLKNASIVQAGVQAAIPLVKGDIAVKLDIALAGKREQPSANAFTGGTPKNNFEATNCVINSAKKGRGKTHNCAHFEMGNMNIGLTPGQAKKMPTPGGKSLLGIDRYKGMQLIDGQTQQVKGGKGILAKVNGGWEPTGWAPFSGAGGYSPAKLSLKNIKEHPGGKKIAEADIQIDLQITVKIWGTTHSTPHFIPVPSPFKAKQNQYLLLLASGAPPKQVQDAINSLPQRSDYCDYSAAGSVGPTAETKYGHKAYPEANQADLRPVSTGGLAAGRSESLQKDAAASYDKMVADAKAQGIDIYAISGFRDNETQKQLFDRQVAIQGSEKAAAKISAPPGYSEHATGYTVDLGTSSATDLQYSFEQTKAYRWLDKNAERYGFEQSFTGKAGQGADNEPWHFRYTGSTAAKSTFTPSSTKSPSIGPVNAAGARSNQSQYLSRIAAGESSGGINVGAYPRSDSNTPYGEYQFRGSTRDAVLAKYPGLDAWSPDKATRDKATLAWIGMYGDEIGVNLLTKIQNGDFASADAALGRNQFTSLPGGAEASPIWNNPNNLKTYGSVQSGGSAPQTASSTTCQAGGVTGAGGIPGTGKGTGQFINPVGQGIDSPYGQRWGKLHAGTDHFVAMNTPVKASRGGVVIDSENGCAPTGYYGSGCGGGYGNLIQVRHDDGTSTFYAHNSRTLFKAGDKVDQGQVIAYSGSSGSSQGPHLHFEIRDRNGVRLDPANFIPGK